MLTRRNFLQLSAAAAAGVFARRSFAVPGGHTPLGVQLYTVRAQAEKNLESILQQIRAIGYDEVEFYSNLYTLPAKELRAMVDASGLRATSGHFNYNGLSEKFDYARQLGLDWIVCSMLSKAEWDSLQGFHEAASQFNEWGRQAQKQGQRFAFHNHNFEFRDYNGTTGYDVLLKETDPKLVYFEMDCYWIAQAGLDPLEMLKKHGNRIRLLHLKDRKAGVATSQRPNADAAHFTEVGSGTIQWKPLLELAKAQGVERYFVEQDQCDRDPMESIAISYKYLHPLM
jgi:sugar phosphate isomerase/epimerase